MQLAMYQVDAFTDRVFSGNPAAVVPLDAWLDDALMQNIAMENNLAETAFFMPLDEPGSWHIRWFTPTVEVPLCGHATLASATVIREKLSHADWPIKLQSASGIDEDPVTGAAHCVLTPYWSQALAKMSLVARQISARGGTVGCEKRGDRVGLSGTSMI